MFVYLYSKYVSVKNVFWVSLKIICILVLNLIVLYNMCLLVVRKRVEKCLYDVSYNDIYVFL